VPTTRPDLSLWREKLFVFLTRNAVSASDYFQIPPKRVMELGTQVELSTYSVYAEQRRWHRMGVE